MIYFYYFMTIITYIYIYMYVCVCVCVSFLVAKFWLNNREECSGICFYKWDKSRSQILFQSARLYSIENRNEGEKKVLRILGIRYWTPIMYRWVRKYSYITRKTLFFSYKCILLEIYIAIYVEFQHRDLPY